MNHASDKGEAMEKPPLGVKPAWAVQEERLGELSAAIVRYTEARQEIPVEWLEELKSLAHALVLHRIKTRGTDKR